MILEGKGFFTWKVPNCEGGDVVAIAAQAKAAGLTHVLVKIADGVNSYNIDPNTGMDHATRLSQALHAQGIKVLGWHYVYGANPIGEANKAIARAKQVGVDAYVIDAEAEYKQPGRRDAARRFMAQLRSALPHLPIGLSSYRYPSYHPELPWREFLEKCDFNMPQVYWMQAHNPGEQLRWCLRQFQALTPYRPVIPTGAAFREHGWQSTSAEVLEFLQTVKELNLTAANFWEWSDARSGILPGVWDTIKDFPWSGEPGPQDISAQYIDRLNTHDPNKLAELYTQTAVHITAARSIQGIQAICAWYGSLFNQILPNGHFKLIHYEGTGAVRHLNWTATSTSGNVSNGNDTFGLIGGKIAYHYSFFSTTG